MDIEKIFNLQDILIADENEEYVIITTKRNFLNPNSSLYVRPRYVKTKDILSQIRTEDVVKNITKNMDFMEKRLSKNNCNYNQIEERITAGILIKRDKYNQLCEMTHHYSKDELLNTDVIDSSILAWAIHNVVELSPYMMGYTTQDNKYESSYAVVEPAKFVHIKQLCNYMATLGYKVDVVKTSSDILKQRVIGNGSDPYQTLCSMILNNQGIYTDGIEHGYTTNVVITESNVNNRTNKPVRLVRKR